MSIICFTLHMIENIIHLKSHCFDSSFIPADTTYSVSLYEILLFPRLSTPDLTVNCKIFLLIPKPYTAIKDKCLNQIPLTPKHGKIIPWTLIYSKIIVMVTIFLVALTYRIIQNKSKSKNVLRQPEAK